eukprot:COSAG01_NODE_541_length_15735_cov_4.534088_9_plen_165_part_00
MKNRIGWGTQCNPFINHHLLIHSRHPHLARQATTARPDRLPRLLVPRHAPSLGGSVAAARTHTLPASCSDAPHCPHGLLYYSRILLSKLGLEGSRHAPPKCASRLARFRVAQRPAAMRHTYYAFVTIGKDGARSHPRSMSWSGVAFARSRASLGVSWCGRPGCV